MNVETAVAWYLDARYGALRPQTWAKHKITLNRFAAAFAGRELDTITRDEVRAWRNGLTVKKSSANKYNDRVKAMYTYLNREEKFVGNPADIVAVRARHIPQAVVARPAREAVVKAGKLVARSGNFIH